MRLTLERYQRIAPLYDILDFPFEYGRYRHIRPQLFQGLSGRILDAGSGTGRNIASYPAAADVVGIDLSPAMLARADKRARHGPTAHLSRTRPEMWVPAAPVWLPISFCQKGQRKPPHKGALLSSR